MRIAFCWIGSSDKKLFDHWDDGLRQAMRHIETLHTVTYHEPTDDLSNVDVVLMWEAPCTAKGEHADAYNRIRKMDKPKILLYAGGPIEYMDAVGFDMYLVESEINEKEFEALELPWRRAFGVNDEVMRPIKKAKQYDGFMQATFADWKRHSLFANALGERGCVAGRLQENDRQGYYDCRDKGVLIFPELSSRSIALCINQSHTVVNTASYWGGGQRCTLEAMACDVPVIVMSDSPKNMEYVLESGAGLVCDPTPEAIRAAVETARGMTFPSGRKYIESKWTSAHYASNILQAINDVCQK
jgi:glycosyltransferase involved in cell wall biosynthesis